MNNRLIDEKSTITGEYNEYTPNGYIDYKDGDYKIDNCIVIFCFLDGQMTRNYFHVDFYKVFTMSDYLKYNKQHFVYFIYCNYENSEEIIIDIKKSKNFIL